MKNPNQDFSRRARRLNMTVSRVDETARFYATGRQARRRWHSRCSDRRQGLVQIPDMAARRRMKAIAGGTLLRAESSVEPVTSAPRESPSTSLEGLGRPAFLHDGERFQEVNSSWVELSGFSAVELLGSPLQRLLPRTGARRTDDPLPGIQELVRSDGARRRIRILELPLAAESPWRCAVTEALLPEDEAVERVDRAELTLACLDEAIIRTDATGRIEYLNVAARTLLGCGDEVI